MSAINDYIKIELEKGTPKKDLLQYFDNLIVEEENKRRESDEQKEYINQCREDVVDALLDYYDALEIINVDKMTEEQYDKEFEKLDKLFKSFERSTKSIKSLFV